MYHGIRWRHRVASTFHGSHDSPSSLVSVTWSTLYVVFHHNVILYVGTRVACNTIFHFLTWYFWGSVIWLQWSNVYFNIIDQFFCMWYFDITLICTFASMIRWSTMYFSISFVLVYILDPIYTWYADMIYYLWAWVFSPQTWAFFLISSTSLAGWNLVISSEVLAWFFLYS